MQPTSSDIRRRRFARWPLALLALAAAGCGATALHEPADGGSRDVVADAPGCRLSNGAFCPAGTSCPAGDGCNTCACPATGGAAACTELGCVDGGPFPSCTRNADCGARLCVFPSDRCSMTGVCDVPAPCSEPSPWCGCDGVTYLSCWPDRPTARPGPCEAIDGGPPPDLCMTPMDCGPARECVFPIGACGAPGTCQSITDCAMIVPYCGCDGVDFRDCPGRPTRPARSTGSCSDGGVVDAGAACTGARLAPNGATCISPDGRTLPNECCFDWNCDTRQVRCPMPPPTCAPGQVPTVAGRCWGTCQPTARCAAMMCGSRRDCPMAWSCREGLCTYP
jgi:hypothetical protein